MLVAWVVVVWAVEWEEEVVVGETEDELEELVESEVGSDPETDPVEEPTDGVVPDVKADGWAAPVAGPTWKTTIIVSASTTMTGRAPSARGRTLSDVQFILS